MNQKSHKRSPVTKMNLVIDCADAGVLAEFYSRLLGWNYTHPHANGWAAITSPDGTVFAFQEVEGYEPPVWPWKAGQQAQMLHLDCWVDDLEEGVCFARDCGAREVGQQFFTTSRTMLDPAGHPFCIDTDGEEENES